MCWLLVGDGLGVPGQGKHPLWVTVHVWAGKESTHKPPDTCPYPWQTHLCDFEHWRWFSASLSVHCNECWELGSKPFKNTLVWEKAKASFFSVGNIAVMWFCLTRPEEVTNIYLSCFVELFSALHISCWDRKQPDGFWEFPFGRVSRCWLVLPVVHGPKEGCPLCPPPQSPASPKGSIPQPSITCMKGQVSPARATTSSFGCSRCFFIQDWFFPWFPFEAKE